MKSIYKLILLVSFFIPIQAFALLPQQQTDGLSRLIEKEFPISDIPYVEIDNRYGKVEIKEWAEQKVKFEVHIEVISADTASQRQVFNSIRIDLNANGTQIIGRTSFYNPSSSLGADLKRLLSGILLPNLRFTIDYVVYMPANAGLNITNKYGSVTLGDHSGQIDINLTSSDLHANDLTGDVRIAMSMGRAFISSVSNGHIDLALVEDILIQKAGKLIVDSKMSKITINSSESLRLNSRRDNIVLKRANRILGSAYFSNLWVIGLSQEISIDAKYGQVNLDDVSKAFSSVNITSENTDISIVFEAGANYQFDLAGNRTRFNYPQQHAKLNSSVNPKDTQILYYVGNIGGGDANSSSVKITSTNASLNIIHQ